MNNPNCLKIDQNESPWSSEIIELHCICTIDDWYWVVGAKTIEQAMHLAINQMCSSCPRYKLFLESNATLS